MKPYGIISDTHHHNWSAFSETLASGLNSRLGMLLNETERCAEEVRKAGGDTIYHTGDLFHVRGNIAPSVLNPTLDCYRGLIKQGLKIVILAGNHDLESRESNRLSSAITALEGVGCEIVNDNLTGLRVRERVIMLPWHQSMADLKKAIEVARDADPNPGDIDLMLHAPIDGVITGLPDHGLDPVYLGSLGFRRVFAGHYHHHKDFGNGVYSVGALAHHSWGDIGSKAGFLVVSDAGVRWFKSRAPEFVEVTGDTDPAEVPLIVDGNYVRAKTSSVKQKEVEDLRAWLTDSGAKGVVILAQKEVSATTRAGGATVSAGASLEVSVNDFIKAQTYRKPEALAVLCQQILADARSAA